MQAKIIYEIKNPLSGETLFVGETRDLETRIEAHKLWSGNFRMGSELQDMRAAGYEPVYAIIEQVHPWKVKERLDYWIAQRRDAGHKLFNRIPSVHPKAKKKPVSSELNMTEVKTFTVILPAAIADDYRFSKHLFPPRTQVDLLSLYLGQLVINDLSKKENSLIEYIEWIYE